MISQITPEGLSPASRARSTAASVCPDRTSTPPWRARSGKHVAGPQQVLWLGLGRDRRQHRGCAIGGRDAGAGLAARVDRHADRRLAQRRVDGHLERDLERVEPLRRQRQTHLAAAVGHHEVDDVWRDPLGRNGQIAFVLAVLIVDDDHHLAVADGGDRLVDGGKRRRDAGARWPGAVGSPPARGRDTRAGFFMAAAPTGASRPGPRRAPRTCRSRRTPGSRSCPDASGASSCAFRCAARSARRTDRRSAAPP